MPAVQLRFYRCIQDSQDFGSDDEHMVSRVFFTVLVDGKVDGDYTADVKQTVGAPYETAPLEVSKPSGYKGPYNHVSFRRCVEQYYRGLVGSGGSGIRISNSSNVRMRNNTYSFRSECGFAADAPDRQAW